MPTIATSLARRAPVFPRLLSGLMLLADARLVSGLGRALGVVGALLMTLASGTPVLAAAVPASATAASALAGSAASGSVDRVEAAGAAALRPNILLIFADDLGYGDLGSYGADFRTPHIDALGVAGARFDQFYVAAPVCTPSRFGLLTGRYPARSRDQLLGALMFLEGRDDRRGIRPGETTVATVLQSAGYRTALIGKWHLGHGLPEFAPGRHGFEHTYGCHGGCVDYFTLRYGQRPDWYRDGRAIAEEGYSTDLITAEAQRWLGEQRAGQPFFLYLAYTAPHYGKGWDPVTNKTTNPLQAKPADRARFPQLSDPQRLEYAAMVAAMDDGVGRVLETLKTKGLDRDTLVIFTSDNGGDPHYAGNNGRLRGQKAQLFEGGIRVPCFMRWPGRITAGLRVTTPITTLDLFPTFGELAGANTASLSLNGDSLVPFLLGRGALSPDRALFWQAPRAKALRQGAWKYVLEGKEEYLFNLDDDPAEQHNLAAVEPRRVADLRARHAALLATVQRERAAVAPR